jgi:ubiquinone/menaquinone biosynthesis C-methylase UbiE
MLQDEYRRLYKKLNPPWKDSVSIYKKLVQKHIVNQPVVLEAGCGFSDIFKNEYKRAKKVIGVDINEKFLKSNKCVDEKIVSDLENIPQVESNSVDLIISSWVFEHLKDPAKVFSEFSRVLKEGGKLVFLTPNSLNYIVTLNRIIPGSLRKFVVGKMSRDLVTDPMPAFYRANSAGKLKQLAKKSGFEIEQMILNGDPTYVAINKLFFYLGIVIEAMLNLPILKNCRVHIIGVMRKK